MNGLHLDKIKFDRLEEGLEISKIFKSENNVRKRGSEVGIEELMQSITKFGLIQPIIVIEREPGQRFELIVGQRRLNAFTKLGKTKIPALVLSGSIDKKTATVVSLSENIHRRALSFDDTIETIDYLFRIFPGEKKDKIHGISKDLGLSLGTVTAYVGRKYIPKEVRKYVDQKKLTIGEADRITAAFWPNTSKIISVAEGVCSLTTRYQKKRAVDYGDKHPEADVGEILEQARKIKKQVFVHIPVDVDLLNEIEKMAKSRDMTIEEYILESITKRINDEKID